MNKIKTKTNKPEKKMSWEMIEEIKNELIDKVDEYFPKIKPQGVNKGRGEAMVIVGIALARFEEALKVHTSRIVGINLDGLEWTIDGQHYYIDGASVTEDRFVVEVMLRSKLSKDDILKAIKKANL